MAQAVWELMLVASPVPRQEGRPMLQEAHLQKHTEESFPTLQS